jgi:hypothetical protein
MKAISLWQPWASAMTLGWKKNETRHWSTNYRGPLLIHAAKKVINWPSIEIQNLFAGIASHPTDLPRGVLLCEVDLIRCERINMANRPKGIELLLGDYTPGRFMWITDNLKTFDNPIPFRGRQGIFNVPNYSPPIRSAH